MNSDKKRQIPCFAFFVVMMFLLLLLISACGLKSHSVLSPTAMENNEVTGVLLLYTEMDVSGQESAVRLLVTKEIMRIDAGPGEENYVLYDRVKKIFFHVVGDQQTVAVKPMKNNVMSAGFAIHWQVESQTSHAVMRQSANDSAQATHYQFMLNDQDCYNVVTVESAYQDVLDAIREYRQALANQAKESYLQKQRSQCQDAVEIFNPDVYLKYGLPIREWSAYGSSRFLVNYRQRLIFPVELFQLPEGFVQIIQ